MVLAFNSAMFSQIPMDLPLVPLPVVCLNCCWVAPTAAPHVLFHFSVQPYFPTPPIPYVFHISKLKKNTKM